MKELSLNILDIAENSTKAGASLVEILLVEEGNKLTLTIADDGCGMSPETARNVTDPFYTTRTTRRVGLGLPLLKLAAEQTGGQMSLSSSTDPESHGTKVCAVFYTDHIDAEPLGDTVSTVVTLVQGHPDTDFHFLHEKDGKELASLDTREVRAVLGDDVPLSALPVLDWIGSALREQYEDVSE